MEQPFWQDISDYHCLSDQFGKEPLGSSVRVHHILTFHRDWLAKAKQWQESQPKSLHLICTRREEAGKWGSADGSSWDFYYVFLGIIFILLT